MTKICALKLTPWATQFANSERPAVFCCDVFLFFFGTYFHPFVIVVQHSPPVGLPTSSLIGMLHVSLARARAPVLNRVLHALPEILKLRPDILPGVDAAHLHGCLDLRVGRPWKAKQHSKEGFIKPHLIRFTG